MAKGWRDNTSHKFINGIVPSTDQAEYAWIRILRCTSWKTGESYIVKDPPFCFVVPTPAHLADERKWFEEHLDDLTCVYDREPAIFSSESGHRLARFDQRPGR